ncbi:MAG: helix-turn-helix domain-containing protein, partial [Acidobacteria bacterium]
MDDERVIEQGQHLSEELAEQRQRAGRKRFWCPVDLRARIVAYAVTCSADGESHRRIAERLGMRQRTLSRWIRMWRQAGAGVRAVAIVPA